MKIKVEWVRKKMRMKLTRRWCDGVMVCPLDPTALWYLVSRAVVDHEGSLPLVLKAACVHIRPFYILATVLTKCGTCFDVPHATYRQSEDRPQYRRADCRQAAVRSIN